MEYSRVAKFKQYRDSFTKENSAEFDTKKSNEYIKITNTLPYEEVMQEMGDQKVQENVAKKEKFRRIYMIAFFALIATALVVGLIFLGILAFRG